MHGSEQSSVNTTQHGARSTGKWDFLKRKDGNVDGKAKVLADALNRISAKHAIGPIDFLECTTRTQFKQCFCSMVGYTASKLDCQINPFLFYDEGSVTAEEMSIKYGSWPNPLRGKDIEFLLRTLNAVNIDHVSAIVYLIDVLPESLVMETRRIVSTFLEHNVKLENLVSWKTIQCNSSLSELEKSKIRKQQKAFDDTVTELLDVIVASLQSAVIVPTRTDIFGQHERWSRTAGYFTNSNSRSEILARERLLFGPLEELISWEERRDYLNKLMKDGRMGIPSENFDQYRAPLLTAESYADWNQQCHQLLLLLDDKNIALPGIKRITPTPTKSTCTICGKTGHVAEKCYSRHKDSKQQDNSSKPTCSLCGKTGHISENCYSRSKSTRDTKPLDNTNKPTCSLCGKTGHIADNCYSQSKNAQTKFGREIKPVLKYDSSLNTVATQIEALPSENSLVTKPRPRVKFCVNGIILDAQLDSCSDVNFITREAMDLIGCKTQFETFITLQTMGNTRADIRLSADISGSIGTHDDNWSIITTARFLVHEGETIPGGSDLLLEAAWILRLHLTITGNPVNGFRVTQLGDHLRIHDAQTQCVEETGVKSCNLIFFDENGYSEEDMFQETDRELVEIVSSLKTKAISMGPLSPEEISSIVIPEPVPVDISVQGTGPPCYKFGYPTSDDKASKLLELLKLLQEENVITQVPKGTGSWVCPGYPVKKGEDDVRFVVDSSDLNRRIAVSPGVRYHSTPEWLSQLPSWGKFYSVLDIKNAFYQLPLSENAAEFLYTSVWTRNEYLEFRWNRAPQGLCVSPGYWCAHIERCVTNLRMYLDNSQYKRLLADTAIVLYADDILVIGRNHEDCTLLSNIVLQYMTYCGMYIPENKIQRCSQSVNVMGFEVFDGQIRVGSKNVAKIEKLKPPRNAKELNTALGMLNYVKWSLNDRLHLANNSIQTLLAARDGTKRFQWGVEQQEAWEWLVDNYQNLALHCLSTFPGMEDHSGLGIIIMSDASDMALGYACFSIALSNLEQASRINVLELCEQGTCRLIATGNRRLLGAEKQYISFDKEGLAIFFALTKCRAFVQMSERTILLSDSSNAIKHFLTPQEVNASLTRGKRWLRWLNDLSDLLFGTRAVILKHVSGESNDIADYFSRNIAHDLAVMSQATQTDDNLEPKVTHLSCLATTTEELEEIQGLKTSLSDWNSDTDSLYIKRVPLRDIWLNLSGRPDEIRCESRLLHAHLETVRQTSKKFELVDGILFRNRSIVVPNSKIVDPQTGQRVGLREFLVRYYHESSPLASHRGEVQTKSSLRRVFWFPSMDLMVQRWIKSCPSCQLAQARQSRDYHSRVTSHPNQLLIVDWTGPIDGMFVIIMVDSFSMFCLMIPYSERNSENTCDALLMWASLFGAPQFWSSDNDSTFVSETSRNLRKVMGINDITVPAYSPCTQGAVENKVGSLKEAIATFGDEILSLNYLLRCVTWGFNSTTKYGTNLSPFEIMLGRPPQDFLATALQGSSPESAETPSEYVLNLRNKLVDIHAYWASKTQDMRLRNLDLHMDTTPSFVVGDQCIRVIYVNGRRQCLDIVTVTHKIPDSHSLYLVRNDSEEGIKVNGYQLVKLVHDPIRDQFDSNIQQMLRIAPIGTMVAVKSGPNLYFGITTSPYLGERIIPISFVIPLDVNGLFRFPSSNAEIDTSNGIVAIDDIIRVGVEYTQTAHSGHYTIVISQFGGRVVS